MRSNTYKHSVGLVGFLGHKRPTRSDSAPSEPLAVVGSSDSPLKADQKTDHLAVGPFRNTEEREIDGLARADCYKTLPPAIHPAHSIITTCQHYGVALRIDPVTSDLVVGKTGAKAEESTQPWPSLLLALETHLEAVARLVESGWTLTAEFPKEAAA